MGRFTIEDAVRRGNKARVALAAPAGGGKTFTMLTIATELADGEPILVMDTERGSASLYADLFKFKTIRWESPYDPRELADEVTRNAANFAVIGIDSLSHFWKGEGGTLQIVDRAAQQQRGNQNKFTAWAAGTDAQDAMVNAILNAGCHVIVTMRSRMEYVQEKDPQGKTQVRRVGMAPVQRDDLEYEFTVFADLDVEHTMRVGKTRCAELAGAVFPSGQGARMGQILRSWLDGADAEQASGWNGWRNREEHDAWRAEQFDEVKNMADEDRAKVKDWCASNGLDWRQPIAKGLADAFMAFLDGADWKADEDEPAEHPKTALCPGGCGWESHNCRCAPEPF